MNLTITRIWIMSESKKKHLYIFIIVLCTVAITMALVFFNQTFYTKKEFSVKQTEKLVSMISDIRDKASTADFSLKNRQYDVSLYLDKKYAYENNIPYYDNLSAVIETGNLNNEKFILNMSASLNSDKIGEYDIVSDQGYYYYYVPGMSEKILRYKREEAEANTLFSKMISYSKLSPEETFDLFSAFFLKTVEALPSDCFKADRGAFGTATVMISARDDELGDAIGAAIGHMKSDNSFQLFTGSVISDETLASLIDGFKSLEATGNNVYSITIGSGITGQINSISVSYVIDNSFNEWNLAFSKNKMTASYRNNSNFESGLKEYTSKSVQVNYGKNSNGTYKGMITYTEDLGSAVVYFDGLCFKDGRIFGNASSETTFGNTANISLEDGHLLFSITSDDDVMASVDVKYTDKAIGSKVPVEDGQITDDYEGFWDDVINSPSHDVFIDKIQAEKVMDWITGWKYE